jgi:competence protein ComEC
VQNKIFYSICFGFIFGVLLRSFVYFNFYLVFWLIFISLVLIFFHFFLGRNKWGILISIFILTFSLGILRFNNVDKSTPNFLESKILTQVSGNGIIVDEPIISENNQKLDVEIEIGDKKFEVLLTTDFENEFKYGDEINFSGKLQKPENFITDTGKEFDYINYLRKDGIFYVMYYPKLEVISEGHGNKIRSALFFVKNKFLEKMNLVIPEPENLLMGGLILGEKASLNQAMRQSFVDTGTIHIVALSGYNVTIVAEWIVKIFSFLPRNISLGVGIFAIFLFVLMTGANSTAVRAGIMAILVLIARATGRNYDVARALLVAGIIMILINPFVLVFDVSFQLSFIATIAVIFFAPKIEKYFLWIKWKWLRDIVAVTCAAYIFVLPFILYKMGNLSLVALPANILVLPFIPITMAFGFFTGLVGMIWYILAVPLGYLSYFLLHYELLVINFFSHLPFASLSIPNFPLILTVLIYLYFIYRLFGRNIKKFFIEF